MIDFSSLPPELHRLIFSYIQDAADSCALSKTSRLIRDVSKGLYNKVMRESIRSISIMLSPESLRSLEHISTHAERCGYVESLVICTTHLPTCDDLGKVYCSARQQIAYRESLKEQAEFTSSEATLQLTHSLNKLKNCKTICVTDSDEEKPMGLSRLMKKISPINPQLGILPDTNYTADDYPGEQFVKQAVKVMMSAAALCSGITRIDIAIGKYDSSASIRSDALLFSMEQQQLPSQALRHITSLSLKVDPDCSEASDLHTFLNQFSALEELGVELIGGDNNDVIDALSRISASRLRSLKLCGFETDYGVLSVILCHYRMAKKITVEDSWLPERQDWAQLEEDMTEHLEFCEVVLEKCTSGDDDESFADKFLVDNRKRVRHPK